MPISKVISTSYAENPRLRSYPGGGISAARKVAYTVLLRVEAGGYASDLLLSEARHLDSRDGGLAHQIVFGSLRYQGQLDYLIDCFAPRRLDPEVSVALRMGVYQLRHLDRIPAHAAVNDSIDLVKAAKKSSAAGLVNAVLRKIPKGPVAWPSPEIEFSTPRWLLDSWEQQFGNEASRRIAASCLQPPETFVRNPPRHRPGLELEPAGVSGAYRVLSGDLTGLRIQDVGSQSIVPHLSLQPGQSFLDLCAAPGNKTAQALESGVRGIACDIHLHRLRAVEGCDRVDVDAANRCHSGRSSIEF
ncbi:MAG: transcription antitermination factor NusB [Bryobacteraceae bacterium]